MLVDAGMMAQRQQKLCDLDAHVVDSHEPCKSVCDHAADKVGGGRRATIEHIEKHIAALDEHEVEAGKVASEKDREREQLQQPAPESGARTGESVPQRQHRGHQRRHHQPSDEPRSSATCAAAC